MNWKQKIIGFNVGDTVIYSRGSNNVWYVKITRIYEDTNEFDGSFARTVEKFKNGNWYLRNTGKYSLKYCERTQI